MGRDRVLLLLVGVELGGAAGGIWAAVEAPAWVAALRGPEAKAFWYASRSTGWVSYGLLWVTTSLGLLLSGRTVQGRAAGDPAELHQFTAGLALAFVALHGLVLLGDRYLHPDLLVVLAPFGFPGRRPWVGLGQLAAYALAAVYATSWARRRIGYRLWRSVHYAAFGAYGLATLHLLGAGTGVGPTTGTLVLASAAAICAMLGLRAWEGLGKQIVRREVTKP
ncbi:MAG: ferric reductase-like transmembrane domain-containing protein [Armatimonadetes bacterium]|nr:ferric reductase-like transmembrane domain-containing protein [Armatimonadota bacterium]MDW8154229.1 ferric reductase-like transmembrane domain-containing protein [Armatimonadota bacterium]